MGSFTKSVKKSLRKLRFRVQGGTHYTQAFYSAPLMTALENYSRESDISDHLSEIFYIYDHTKSELVA